ncbi:uncharacterized protein LOC107398707 [Tribolium castaneum]|uniref:uncharacterized protein LOC107398707 n=1 Tax=Tribolium castaneum TaxID=7070 RepID=UPI00077DBF6D|nr:PREDICTED: uncharacterized protein LOC107398707 [Tribolium castaneum]|eukprot:XP_015839322.1 PREDICTED: uncharacterized protein LOC107398707 [Tribolium castaneum]
MSKYLILLAFILISTKGDYVPDSQRAELVFYNKTIVKDMHFRYGKYNRTISAMNASYVLLRDFTDAKMMFTIHGDQFFHNEFRFTGQKLAINACQLWKLNMFHLVEQFENVGLVMDLCNLKKGPYHITNFIFDSDVYPKYMPKGLWRVSIKVNHENVGEILFVRWYFELK